MLITGIKSKPVYAPLAADTGGRYHVMLGSGVGREPLLRVLGELRAAEPGRSRRTQLLYVPAPGDIAPPARSFRCRA